MARTSGHGNPDWSRDEIVLALELYLECGGKIPGRDDPRVQKLSDTLRSLPYHSDASRQPTFRNADGVTFKLQNLRQVASGKGLDHVGRMDRLVWADYGTDRERVSALCSAIRSGIVSADGKETDPEGDEFPEGRVLSAMHTRRERNRKLRRRLLLDRRKNGGLVCDLCGRGAGGISADFEEALFEAHHLVGLVPAASSPTRLSDVALLHADCHRLTHAAILRAKNWLTLREVRDVVGVKYANHSIP